MLSAETKNMGIENFNPKVIRFSRWILRLEDIFKLCKVDDVENKKVYLLHYIGARNYDMLCDKVAPASINDKNYEEIKKMLQDHFEIKKNEVVEIYKFMKRKQKDNENIEDFIQDLRSLATSCCFGEYLDKAIRNQIVMGVKSDQIQQKLLEDENLTLQNAVKIATAMELSKRGGDQLHKKSVDDVQLIQQGNKVKNQIVNHRYSNNRNQNNFHTNNQSNNYITSKFSNSSKNYCFRCGFSNHLANKCKHITTKCNFCSKIGHLESVCLAKNNKVQNNNTNINKYNSHKVNHTNFLDEVRAPYDKENNYKICEEYMSNILAINDQGDSKFFIELYVNNIPNFKLEIDSGSPVSLISVADKAKYFNEMNLEKTDRIFKSFCGNEIPCVGRIKVNVYHINKSYELYFYVVVANRHPILGREWLREIKINWDVYLNNSNVMVNQIASNKLNDINGILEKYKEVFDNKPGKINGFEARINIKENTTPVFIKARPIPFAIKNLVEEELGKMVEDGILEKVNASEWATPIVPVQKANNRVRICGDYKVTVNPHIIVDQHPLPTVDELFANIAGGKKFTKIDLAQAYLQLQVHEQDRNLLTLNTHLGLYRPTRLMYGISSAPAIWQRHMTHLLADIPGVTFFLDDIKITGPDDKTHLGRIEEVLSRLHKYNMKVNKTKCEFFADKIEYCGYIIDRQGIHKTTDKVEAMTNMPEPKDKDQIRAFVGLVNYYGRFLPNLSTILYPINNLLKKDVKFDWDIECRKSFEYVKDLIKSEQILCHYDSKLPILLATDASPYGVGAVLSHKFEDGSERPIQYASQTLTETQQKYTHLDKECYAVIFGIKNFYQYLYGRSFTLIIDNTALQHIFSPKKGIPTLTATRLQHYAIFLNSFDYTIQLKTTKQNANADCMSRLPLPHTSDYKIDEIDVLQIDLIENLPVTVEQLAHHTKNDKRIRNLVEGLKNGMNVLPEDRFQIDQMEFSLQNGCILRGIRVYIPPNLRNSILQELHSGHFGINRMKSLARGYCWWSGLDNDIENMVKDCTACQESRPLPIKVPIHKWENASKPFERVHVDFAGPFLGKYLFFIVDSYSKWIEVKITKNITTETTMKFLREFFATFGIPDVLVSDHGTQFTAADFQNFLNSNGIQHKMGAPYHPSTNGQAERYVRTIKNKLKMINHDDDLHTSLQKILLAYRKTIHPVTNKSPSMLVFGRQIKSRLDLILPSHSINSTDSQKQPTDTLKKKFEIQDRVAIRDYMAKNKWKFGNVVEKLGHIHYLVKLDDSRIWKRHVDQMRKVNSNVGNPKGQIKNTSNPSQPDRSNFQGGEIVPNEFSKLIPNRNNSNEILSQNDNTEDVNTQSNIFDTGTNPNHLDSNIVLRRSDRITKKPDRFIENY